MNSRIDYVGIIKQAVTVPDAVQRYTGQRIYRNRIKCPVHNGADYNMRIYPRSYHCFVCHATGDVIQFVQSVMGLSFQDAMKRLNEDFNLGLPIGTDRNGADAARLSELNKRISERQFAERMEQIDTELNGLRLANLSGLLHTVEQICETERPKSVWSDWRADWCEAMRLRTELRAELI